MSHFKHPLVTNKPDHPHLPTCAVLMFKISPQFLEVVKFYFSSSLVMMAKNNDVDRPAHPDRPGYNPKDILEDFDSVWAEESHRLVETLGTMFVSAQSQASGADGVCVSALKEIVGVRISDAIDALLSYPGPDTKLLFDIDVVKLVYNDNLIEYVPKKIVEHLEKTVEAQSHIYSIILDAHPIGTKLGGHKDISNPEEFYNGLMVRFNILHNTVSKDSVHYGTDYSSGLALVH